MNTSKTEKLFNRLIASKKIHEGVCLIENSAGDFSFIEYNRNLDTPILMASITKLFTTTCILALMQEGKLSLQDKISRYLPKEAVAGLHIYKGKEYSFYLTIEHLLFQTSGLPDYYLDGGSSIFQKVIKEDFSFTFENVLEWVKSINPRFLPGTKRKAYYSDINFDLLGKIIEQVNQSSLQEAYEKYIFAPLNLQNTYLASAKEDVVPYLYYKQLQLERPLFIRSCYASGGGITTAKELMIFIKAFWSGKLFDKVVFSKLTRCNPLQLKFYPLGYKSGYMKINTSYPFGKKYALVGHSGSTGSFAFYCPQKDLFLVGDLPQMTSPSTCVRFAMQAVLTLK